MRWRAGGRAYGGRLRRLTSGLASEAPTAVATGFVSGAAALATASWFVSEAATTATAGFASDPVRASLDADSAQA